MTFFALIMHNASNGSMKSLIVSAFLAGWAVLAHGQDANPDTGPAAALKFAMSYRGPTYVPGVVQCYPDAEGIPFSDTKNIIPMLSLIHIYGFLAGVIPIGRTIKFGDTVWQIVGVCRDSKCFDIKKGIDPTTYFPFRQRPIGRASVAIRTLVPTASVSKEVLSFATAVDPNVPVGDILSLIHI